MYRFFVDRNQIQNDLIQITGSDVNHIKNVLRLKPGEEISVCTGESLTYYGRVESYTSDSVIVSVQEVSDLQNELASEIVLYQGIPKGDKMDLIVQKAVELGAAKIVPVSMERCVVKLDSKKEAARIKRWNAIAESAAKQAKRMMIPEVTPVMSFLQAVEEQAAFDMPLMPYELTRGMEETKEVLSTINPGQSISVMIGPEGGFSVREAETAIELGIRTVSLGKRILRTETAGLAMLSILMYLLESKTSDGKGD